MQVVDGFVRAVRGTVPEQRRARCGHRRAATAAFLCLGLIAAAAPAHAQQYRLVSKAADGTAGDRESRSGMFSADTNSVAFLSAATNLVTGDTNAKWDVFVKDLQTQAVVRVSVASDGTERTEDSGLDGLDVSRDGRVVVFSSSAALVAEDTNTCELEAGGPGPCPDIYVRDRTANTTTRVSVTNGGVQANGRSWRPRISDDGRYVVFSSIASNLVDGDSNGVEDVFLHDRQTGATTRVSVTSTGTQVDLASFGAEISGNGARILFVSAATGFSSEPDPLPCPEGTLPCWRAFVRDLGASTTTAVRVTIPTNVSPRNGQITEVAIDGAGRFVVLGLASPASPTTGPSNIHHAFWVTMYDLAQGEVVKEFAPISRNGSFGQILSGGALSGDGRVAFHGGGTFSLMLGTIVQSYSVFDRHTGLFEPSVPGATGTTFPDIELSTDGRLGLITAGSASDPTDTNGAIADVYIFSRDADNDSIADTWETQWGLNPSDSTDAAGDPDGDGRTNLQEYQAGSHPRATMTRYFAEGASNAFFRTRIALLNTSDAAANVVLRFLGSDGVNGSTVQSVPARTRVTFDLGPGANVPANDFSTVIEADQAFVADRTMTWDATGYGAHAETATVAPDTTWFLAEGATGGFFSLFYLLQNANDVPAVATIDYLRPAPAPVITKVYTLAANSRLTIPVDEEDPDLAGTDVSAAITTDQPIIVERAMYLSTPGQPPFAAGHDGAGVTDASTSWFLAEGATGDFFDEYVLIANPGTADAIATVSYLLPDGTRFSKEYPVARQSRVTISVEGEDPRLAGTSVAVVVDATQPVVVERAMWWPAWPWYEGHLAVGSTTTGTRWALAEGEIGLDAGTGGDTETYILIANTGNTAGSATVTLFHENGNPATSQITVELQANSRVTVPVSSSFPAADFGPQRRFGAIVESTGAPIVVERAMYTTTNGLFWSAGTSSLATKLQ